MQSLALLLFSTAAFASANVQLFKESFEDVGALKYSIKDPLGNPLSEFIDPYVLGNPGAGGKDYMIRTDGSDFHPDINYVISTDPNIRQGTHYFAVQDTDHSNSLQDIVFIEFDPIDITGIEDLRFSGLFAEDESNPAAWDANSKVYVQYKIDGGSWTKILQFATDQTSANLVPLLDSDLDGTGDASGLDEEFAPFNALISGTGVTLNLRIGIEFLDGTNEDIAFDNIIITGTDPLLVGFEIDPLRCPAGFTLLPNGWLCVWRENPNNIDGFFSEKCAMFGGTTVGELRGGRRSCGVNALPSDANYDRVISTPHPYTSGENDKKIVALPGVECFRYWFSPLSTSGEWADRLTVFAKKLDGTSEQVGREFLASFGKDGGTSPADAIEVEDVQYLEFVFKANKNGVTDYGYDAYVQVC